MAVAPAMRPSVSKIVTNQAADLPWRSSTLSWMISTSQRQDPLAASIHSARTSVAINRCTRRLQPIVISALKLRANLGQHVSVIAIEPADLVGVEHAGVDQAAVDRREGQGLEPEHFL